MRRAELGLVLAGFGCGPCAARTEIGPTGLTDDFIARPMTPKGSEIEAGTRRHLFHTPLPAIGILFDVFSDGKRLLVNRAEEEA